MTVIYYPDVPDIPLPPGHRFPAAKYRLLRARLEATGELGATDLIPSPLASRADLVRAHQPVYVDTMLAGSADPAMMRAIGLPWSETLMMRSRATVGGTLAAATRALVDGFSGQLAGGTHHAHRDRGAGFCVFNDFAVAALTLLDGGNVERLAIVDLDVHQGDGTAAILNADPRVYTLSIHGAKNYPFVRVAGTRDIDLADGTGDAAYLACLAEALRPVLAFDPQLVLYQSGVDPLAEDLLGRLSLTLSGLAERDRLVFDTFHRRGVPVAVGIGGGYAEPLALTVEAYANTFRVARTVYGY